MRILCVNYEYPPLGGGAGNATANIAREMVGLGEEVMVLTSAFKGLPKREERDGYVVRRIPTLRAHKDHCRPFEMATFMLSSCLAVPRAARAFKADAVVAFFGLPCGPAAWLAKKRLGIPYIVSLRGGDVPGFQPYDLKNYHRLTAPLIHFLWRGASHVVANSQGLRNLALSTSGGVPVSIIPNGVDARLFSPLEIRPDGPVRLLFVGRVVRQKGLDVLFDALAGLDASLAWTLAVVGDGPARVELAARANRLGLMEKIRFLGWQGREAMPGLYREADIFVFPSRDEGMPNAVLEAMASGLPVVATRISGNEELVRHDETGLLVPPEDTAALGQALARLLSRTEDRAAMGEGARRLAETEYSWKSVARRYLDLCKEAS